VDVTTDPPPGLIPIPMKGAVLLFTTQEFMAAIRRGKQWRRRVAMERREPSPQGGVVTLTEPDAPVLVYHLSRCDGCGATLAPRERLAGLCPVCRDASTPPPCPTPPCRKHALEPTQRSDPYAEYLFATRIRTCGAWPCWGAERQPAPTGAGRR
jgi:hypothetical protein